MSEAHYDAIIIGSGAGGSATASSPVQNRKRVLLLEKGGLLPRDGSTLDLSDGSVPLRSSRVNPALTIYAWGLRLGDHLVRT